MSCSVGRLRPHTKFYLRAAGGVDFAYARSRTVTVVDLLQVGEAAVRCGVSPNTLRYYERVGLVDPVDRDASGWRVYDEHAIARVVFVTRLRATGMSIRKLREFMDLARAGDHTVDRRWQILQEHRARLCRQRDEIDACLQTIDRKIAGYSRLTAQIPKRKAS